MTKWKQGDPPPVLDLKDSKGAMRVEVRAAASKESGNMMWSDKKPTRPGFYFFQDSKLRAYSHLAVLVVQVSKYANRPGFNAATLHQDHEFGEHFSGDLCDFRFGYWAGPLPEPIG